MKIPQNFGQFVEMLKRPINPIKVKTPPSFEQYRQKLIKTIS